MITETKPVKSAQIFTTEEESPLKKAHRAELACLATLPKLTPGEKAQEEADYWTRLGFDAYVDADLKPIPRRWPR